jgi:hypothetical protein
MADQSDRNYVVPARQGMTLKHDDFIGPKVAGRFSKPPPVLGRRRPQRLIRMEGFPEFTEKALDVWCSSE